MALTPFDGELDAPVSGLAPFTGKLDGEPEGIAGGLRAATESGKAIAGDIGTGLNIGTTVDIPEQVIGINALARAMTPAGILSGMVTPQAAKDVRGKIEGVAREAIDSRRNNLSSEFSPEQQAANKKQFFTDDASWKNLTSDGILSAPGKAIDLASKGELFGEGWSDWRKPVGSAVQSAPSSLLMMTPTALASKTAAQTAIKEAAAAGLAADAAQAAGVKAAERTAMIAGGLSEGAQGAGSAYEQTRRTVLEMPEEKLRSSPFYQEQLAANGGDAKAARAKAAEAAALTSASGAFWFDALFGAIGDKYIGTAAAGKGTRTGALARGAAQETPTEFIQSGGEKLTENLAMKRFADPSQDLMQNVGEEATGGALSGAIMGAGMGAAFHRSAGIAAPGSAPPATPALLPDTGPISRSANIAIQTGAANLAAAAQAADVLGAPPVENNDTLNNQPAETGPVAPNIGPLDTAAAAADPVRAQQTDAANIPTNQGTNVQSSAANQDMQNRDRTRAASVVQMQKIAQNPDYELASIARDSNGAPMVGNNGAVAPAAVGKKERVTLPDGTKINTNYAVVEADSLSPSHFADGTANAGYGKDGKLTALNNGRTAGLMQAYNIGTAGNYRAALEEDTDGHGIPREVIAGMKAPVLVRLYDPASVDQSNLGARSNQASALGLGTSEQANSDAAMIDSMDGLNPDDSGDFATSRDFIRRFMSRLPQTEQAGMVDADGALSQSGYARVRNAILAKAYGESPVLARMVESMDDNMRNIGRALMQAAPEVAKLRQDVKDGALFDADITPDLLAAVEELARLKDSGRSVSDYLAQTAMFDGASPEARDLLQFLADNMRRPRKIAEFIQRYAEALRAAGNPNQGSLLGEAVAPTKREIINVASEQDNAETQTDRAAAGETGGTAAGQAASQAAGNATPGQETGGQRASQEGDRRGAQGNEGQELADELNRLNPQLKQKLTVEWVDENDPRTKNHNGGAGGTLHGGHNGSSIILVRGKADFQALLHELRHMVDMLLGGYELRKWLRDDKALFDRVVAYLRKEREAGRIDKYSRMTDAEETAQSVLDAYYRDKERLRSEFPDLVTFLEQMGADKYAHLFDESIGGQGATVNAENGEKTEWVAFPPETGTLGIPRADMPQVKGTDRGALVQFLKVRGIDNETVENVQADSLRPTQAEFSTTKTEKWGEVREGVDRSILASSDGFILDGHHQWVAGLAAKQPVKVIRFNAPIDKLLAEVFQFPSVKQAEGADPGRAKAREDFDVAMAELGALLRQINPGVRMLTPEEKVELMPTLVKLFESGIRVLGHDMKALIADVKKAMKASADEFVRKHWNKIDERTYREAAAQAIDNVESSTTEPEAGQTLDMFAVAAKAKQAKPQGDLFETMTRVAPEVFKAEAQKVVSEGGKPVPTQAKLGKRATEALAIMQEGGYWRKALETSFIGGEKFETRLRYANGGIATGVGFKTFTEMQDAGLLQRREVPKSTVYAEEWGLREKPLAQAAKPEAAPAIPAGWKLAENGKEYTDEHGFVRGLKMSERERAVEQSFYDAIRADTDGMIQRYLDGVINPDKDGLLVDPDRVKELSEDFKNDRAFAHAVHEPSSHLSKLIFSRLVKDNIDKPVVFTAGGGGSGKTEAMPVAYTVSNIDRGGVVVDSTLSAFNSAKKKIDEVLAAGGEVSIIYTNAPVEKAFSFAMKRPRVVRMVTLAQAHQGASDTIRALSEHYKDNPKVSVVIVNNLGEIKDMHVGTIDDVPHYDYNEVERRLYGIAEQALKDGTINQERFDAIFRGYGRPGGEVSVGEAGGMGNANDLGGIQEVRGDAGRNPEGGLNEHAKPGESSPEGKEPGAVPGSANPRGTGGVRDGNGGRDSQPNRVDGSGNAPREQVGQAGPDDAGAEPQGGGRNGKGNRAGRNAGVPAGRDIPVKSGKNYAFGDTDLTYEGSWLVKARQNVEAVELLKSLEKDGRQATREEQAILAKFIGWGASDLANSIFGNKLDAQAKALSDYDQAIENLGNKDYLTNSNYYAYQPAFAVLKAKNDALNWYTTGNITRAMLDAAKPDASVKRWIDLRNRVKSAMTAEEWAEASRSTQYAHYTSKPIVKAMWSALERMGFKGGTILEPGAGIGVFPGLMSHGMAANSIYTGIEFDSITGGILKQLFPDERILVESFIDSKLPAGFYDVAAGNPPFNNTAILADPKYKKFAFALHDYFFAKSIDSVKPGGLVMFVTSRYTMDKLNDKARAYLAERADLVGAIRLPQTAFKKNAGTDVVTDVLFLRKKVDGETFEQAQPWAKSVPMTINGRSFPVNEYFHAHPEMVLGKHSDAGKMANSPDPQYTVEATEGDIDALFEKAAANLPADIYKSERGSAAEAAAVREIDFNPKAQKEGNYYVTPAGVLMQREGGIGLRVEKNNKDVEVLKDFVSLRDALKQSHYDQLNSLPNETGWEDSLAALRQTYDAFVKKHGRVNQFTETRRTVEAEDEETGEKFQDERVSRRFPLISKIQDDPDYSLVMALEKVNDDTGEITDSPFLSGRVLGKPEKQEIRTTSDALLAVLNDTGKVDIPAIAERMGIEQQEAIDSLGSLIYQDPSSTWQMADEYLSGNVKKKLRAAQEAAKSDSRYVRNVEALMAVQPAPVPASDITVSIGMNWIPAETYEQFLEEKTGVSSKVHYNERTGQWAVEAKYGNSTLQATQDWGTKRRSADEILLAALTGAPIRITERQKSGETIFLADATEAANQKLAQMRQAFGEWIWQDAARADALLKVYNDKFNTIVPRKFDGSHLTLPGKSQKWNVFDHVKRGAWRIIQSGNTYLAHAVGSGKTFQMIISAMEQKRLGLIQKPMMVVPNHMLKQFAAEWVDLYPAARLMVADEKNFHTENRRRFVSRVAMSDLDGVIITHSAFKLLDLDPEFKQKMIGQELDYLRAALKEAGGEEGGDKKKKSRDPKVKQIESKIEKMEQKLEAAMSDVGKDKNVRFDQLGVDMLYVDEAHEFRKLAFTTQRQVKGIDSSGSDRAFDLWMKTRWLEEKKPGRSLVMASGTPVTNTLAELFSVQRFMAPDVLEERGLDEFDAWASMFGQENTEIESDASGKYAPVTRFSKFVNVPELTQMFREFADVLTSEHLAGLLKTRPTVKGGTRKIVITPQTAEYSEYKAALASRLDKSRAWKPTSEEPNNPDPVIKIIGDGRLAAIDMRFVNPSASSDPDSKLNRMADEVIRVYKETAGRQFPASNKEGAAVEDIKGATQVVFSDLGFGAGVAANRGFNARAWFEKRLRDAGIPPKHVAFMADNKKSVDKLRLFKDVNAGRVRIVVGSSKNMGTGVNMQQRLAALHHLDTPWFPADLEQREGRIVRQGNKHAFDAIGLPVELYAYSTKGSYDAVMWQMLASKQRFIDQALSGDSSVRSIDDLSESSQFQIATAMTSDDPRAMQLAGVRAEVEKLQRLSRSHEENRSRMRMEYDWAGSTIEMNERKLPEAIKAAEKVVDLSGEGFRGKVGDAVFDSRKEFGDALLTRFKEFTDKLGEKKVKVGELSGFNIAIAGRVGMGNGYSAVLGIETPEAAILAEASSADAVGVAMRAINAVSAVARQPAKMQQLIEEAKNKRAALESRIAATFPMAEMLADKVKEAQDLEVAMMADQNKLTGREREQQLEDEWQKKTGAITPLLSRGNGAGMALRDLQAVSDRIAKGLKNLPRVHVLESPAALSTKDPNQKSLREFIRKAGAWDDVEGATHNGEIYLFASGLADEARAEHVLATHEVTHYGLRGAIGKDLDSALQTIWMNNASVRKAASALKARNGLTSNIEATEEVLADMRPQDLAKLSGWRRVVKAVRDWLGRIGAKRLAARVDAWLNAGLDEQQQADLFVADLVNSAREWVRSGKGRPYMEGTLLADGSLAEDVAAQEKWLTAEAKARGYKSIDEMAEKNYKAFENLAKLWRDKHPADSLLSRATQIKNKAHAALVADRIVELADASGIDVTRESATTGSQYLSLSNGGRILRVRIGDHKQRYGGNDVYIDPSDDGSSIEDGIALIRRTFPGMKQRMPANKSKAFFTMRSEAMRNAEISMFRGHRSGSYQIVDIYPLVNKIGEANSRSEVAFAVSRVMQAIEAPTPDGGKLGSRSLSNQDAGAADLRADESGQSVEPAQSVSGAGSSNNMPRLSRSSNTSSQTANQTATQRADQIISKPVATWRPVDTVARTLTHAVRLDALTAGVYDRAARLLDRYTPEAIKAGVISDYGIPEAVLDERTAMQGRMRVQLRKSGELLDKMATLTRSESRVAYEWMNNADPQALSYFEAQLPPESVKVMEEIKAMIDALSQEAVALKQLDPEAFKRNRFEYLRRSYVKHTAELTKGEMDSLRRAIAILGDQYKGRGMTDAVDMAKFKNVAPEWWGRKLQEGKADKGLKGERFIRLERRAPTGEGVMALETAQGPGDTNRQKKGRLLEVAYWPAGEAIPVKYSTWDQSGTWEVVDAKGGELIVWRDFTKQERISMGEIDEARYAIAKTLHSMIHDIETGRYLEWLATTYAKKPGESIDGKVVEASERMRDVFKPGEWVKVPETKVAGTSVAKYGLLAGRYLPGPIWNDVRQTVGFRFKPLGETYAAILGAWKTSKTALSPAVHTNNVMANFVMADWHDVTAGHIVKALRIILGASQRDGRGAIGRTGNVVSRAGIADAEAAREIINRFLDSGANLGSWVTAELQKEQLEPLLKALENEVGTVGQTMAGQVGAMVAVQKALQLRFPSAWDAFKPTRAGQVLTTEAKNMIDLYEAEDQVFRLAAWLRAKEGGSTDAVAGKVARRSFLDYHINAPWIQAMRSSALPFISFTYRAVPMMLEVAAKKPHKIMKLALAAAAINALGYLLSGGDEDDERRLLPEEKAGRVWGLVPKLVRMPWNDANNSPVFLDIRRFVPVGDVFDIGQNHAALPLLPVVIPGGPLAVVAELVANRSQFTGRAITLETDTPAEQAEKVADHIYKAFAPNIVILPGTYAWTGVSNAASGRTDSFGREQSPAQATASAFGVKLGSYPKDVLQLNAQRAAQAKIMEIDRNITQLKREYQHNGIDSNAFEQRVESQQNKKRAVLDRLQEKMGGN